MMLGRNESMPNTSAEADMSPGDRDIARALALDLLERDVPWHEIPRRLRLIMLRAVVRYVPGGVPDSPAPEEVAAADDRTRPAELPLVAGVICEPIEEGDSSGVCEATGDGDDDATKQAQIDHTAMHRSQDGQAFIVKRGNADRVAIPHLPDKTRR